MKHKYLAIVIVAFVTVAIAYSYVEKKNAPHKQEQNVAASEAAPANVDRDEIKAIVREYILENPAVIIESVEKMQVDKAKEADAKREGMIKENFKELTENPNDPKAGDLKSANYVIEFFDYGCGYCKRMMPVKEKLLREKKDVKIIFKEFPVLGEFSEAASKTSLAVYKAYPAKYMNFHSEMLKHNGPRTKEAIDAIVEKLEMDKDKIHETMKDPKIQQTLEKNHELAMKLGVMGSPAYIVNGKFQAGALDYAEIMKMMEK